MGRTIAFLLLGSSCILAQQHSYSPTDIENGALLYRAHCAVCHGQDGDAIAGVNLRNGKFRRASSDDDIIRVIAKGIPGTAMPPHNFQGPQLWALVAYLRTMRDFQSSSKTSGDAAGGRLVFEGKAQCLSCHRVNGKGGRLGPDLSDVGVIRPVSHLKTSLIDPDASILPQHRSVQAVTREGVVITGRRLNEDTHTLQLLDEKDRLVSLTKADLREYVTLKTSPMPSYKDKLDAQEMSDLLAYLVSLKGSSVQ